MTPLSFFGVERIEVWIALNQGTHLLLREFESVLD
jgi:hypothetical protein